MTHDFHERLEWSKLAGDSPFIRATYEKAFPGCTIATNGNNNQAQRLGIDRVILLPSGKVLNIDEKLRETTYQDFLLEFLSNDRTGAPGWIEKDLQMDYLLYGWVPARLCFLFPWPVLRRAWAAKGDEWKRKHRVVRADNGTYLTHSVIVPFHILLNEIGNALRIDVPREPLPPLPPLPTVPARDQGSLF